MMVPSHRFIASALLGSALWAPGYPTTLAAEGDTCQSLPTDVESAIALSAERLRGAEICDVRSIAVGDINADQQDDYVVAYTVEGPCFAERKSPPGSCGNNYLRFLAAFLRNGNSAHFTLADTLKAGGRFQRSIDSITIRDGVIAAQTSAFNKHDASCCPSVHGDTTYTLRDKKLVENGGQSRHGHKTGTESQSSRQSGKSP